jgi:hypothetical protein
MLFNKDISLAALGFLWQHFWDWSGQIKIKLPWQALLLAALLHSESCVSRPQQALVNGKKVANKITMVIL